MGVVREVSSAEATAFLRQHDKLNIFKTGTVGFYLMVGVLQAALATAPGPRKRSTVESMREVSTPEAAKLLRKHDKLKVLKTGQLGHDTGVSIVQVALAYSSPPRPSAKTPVSKAPVA